jgi:hypothetical protein
MSIGAEDDTAAPEGTIPYVSSTLLKDTSPSSLVNAPEGATVINPATGKEIPVFYSDRKDVPEGATVLARTRPARTLTEAYARAAAAERGEPDPYATYTIFGLPHAEGELYKKVDGLYGFMKDGKEYYYAPKEFGNYGVMGQTKDPELGRTLVVNRNLQNKDILAAGKATKLDSSMKLVDKDDFFGSLKNPYDGYVWAANDYIKAQNPDYTKSYDDGSYDTYINKNINATRPDNYGTFLGYTKDGNYVYKRGDDTVVWNAAGDGTVKTYTPPKKSAFQEFAADLGPLATVATAIFAPAYLPLVTGAQTAIQGGDLEDILESAGKSYVLQQVGQGLGSYGDQAATAAQYGTDLGSTQNAMLAAQEAGMGTVADVAGNVIGQVGTSIVSPTITGRDTNPLDVLLNSGVSAATPFITNQIEGFSDLPVRAQNAINTVIASEMTGRDPTNAVIAEALRAGKDAYNNESKAIAAGWDSYSQLQDAAGLGIATKDDYLAYQQGPRDDGTTAGIKEIVDQTQTGPRDDGTTADVQALIDQIQSAPQDDGTTAGIQDIIDTLPTPAEPAAPPPVEPEVTDDGTTDGIQDVIKDLPNLEGGDLGMTEEEAQNDFYRQIGIDPNSLSDSPPATQEEIDATIGMYPQAAGSTGTQLKAYVQAFRNSRPSTPPPPPAPPPGPTTPKPPTTPTAPTGTPTGSNNLLALLALADQPVQQQPQPVPLADIKYYYDFGDDLVPEKPQNTQNMPARFEFFDGGEVEDLSVDDLIRMLQGD